MPSSEWEMEKRLEEQLESMSFLVHVNNFMGSFSYTFPEFVTKSNITHPNPSRRYLVYSHRFTCRVESGKVKVSFYKKANQTAPPKKISFADFFELCSEETQHYIIWHLDFFLNGNLCST